MNEPKRIKLRIDKEGNVEFEIQGIKGSGCDDLARIFEALGDLTLGEKTSEYYESEVFQQLSTRRR